jgi:hypothetical protein
MYAFDLGLADITMAIPVVPVGMPVGASAVFDEGSGKDGEGEEQTGALSAPEDEQSSLALFTGGFLSAFACQESAMQRKQEIARRGPARRLCSASRGVKACVLAGLHAVLHVEEVAAFMACVEATGTGSGTGTGPGTGVHVNADIRARTAMLGKRPQGSDYLAADAAEDAKYLTMA